MSSSVSSSRQSVVHSVPIAPAHLDVQTYIDQTAALLGLYVPPEIRPSVVENFERIRAIAQPVLDFELPDDLTPAPQFDP